VVPPFFDALDTFELISMIDSFHIRWAQRIHFAAQPAAPFRPVASTGYVFDPEGQSTGLALVARTARQRRHQSAAVARMHRPKDPAGPQGALNKNTNNYVEQE